MLELDEKQQFSIFSMAKKKINVPPTYISVEKYNLYFWRNTFWNLEKYIQLHEQKQQFGFSGGSIAKKGSMYLQLISRWKIKERNVILPFSDILIFETFWKSKSEILALGTISLSSVIVLYFYLYL